MNSLFESFVLHRFKNLEDLEVNINKRLNNYIKFYRLKIKELKVKEIVNKSYYDSEFQDWEIICIIGNSEEDLFDLSIYYAKTRNKENIITEIGYEKV